ncbi:MAG: CDP-diacylglycerol--glycerol-3-phosphate 3-phosphatidyltransferase [Bdellovibrionales bacterium]|nr:CDP-diacylglycerol--glycerol-3-phosphate 3-phosphatidyltransferase [Bdellovibrionales bacterium]
MNTEVYRVEMSVKKSRVPNILTILRLLLVPAFVILMSNPTETMVHAAIVVFLVAALSDYLDGWLARKMNAVTDLGKLLDPLADKILVMTALIMLVAQRSDIDGLPWVPAWMVVLLLAREIWVTGLRGVAASKGMVIAASQTGKVKSALQMIAIVFLLLHEAYAFDVGQTRITCEQLGLNFLLVSLIISYWSAVEYTFRAFDGTPAD